MKNSHEKALAILKLTLQRGQQIIGLLEKSEYDEADELLTFRKAGIYNFFSTPIADEILAEHTDITRKLIDRILVQNELLENKIEEKRRDSIDELKLVVSKKFQFKGYVNATNIKRVNFEGSA